MKASASGRWLILILRLIVVAGLILAATRVIHGGGDSVYAPVIVPCETGRVPTLFIVGDSTAHYSDRRGWADRVDVYFDPNLVKVENRALAGRSSRSFQEEGAWDRVLAELKPGDFMIVQFGHNDAARLDKRPERGTLPGIGEKTRKINWPEGQTHVVHTFGWYMTKYITEAKAKGANPIVLSTTLRDHWKHGRIIRDPENYGKWVAQVARAQNVIFIDLNTIIAERYDRMGEEQVKAYFPGLPEDDVHTSKEGAQVNAALVISGLKSVKDLPLCKGLSARGQSVGAYVAAPAK
jgi:rhamnogalacturonan acetylesterase